MKIIALAGLLASILLVNVTTAAAAAVKIMPLGDAITSKPGDIAGCWRATVYTNLTASGFSIDFVGSQKGQDCGVTYDSDNEGHPNILVTDIASKNQLPPWLSATNPDVVMFHLGTGDSVSQSTDNVLAAYTKLVQQMRDNNPKIKIIVSQLIPITIAQPNTKITGYNTAIPAWATKQNTTTSPIWVVDVNTGYPKNGYIDGVHPNAAGNAFLASKYLPILETVLKTF